MRLEPSILTPPFASPYLGARFGQAFLPPALARVDGSPCTFASSAAWKLCVVSGDIQIVMAEHPGDYYQRGAQDA